MSSHDQHQAVPITVFTGYLGSGKTTIILNIIKQLPNDYKVVLLKNEFGDVEVDSAIALNSHIAVKEMTNGCLCCTLVGKMQNAIEEILKLYSPDRIIIETSGSAYPAPIALQIKNMDQGRVNLDGIVTVIDALNFSGYIDKSYTAKIQAQFTDLILINKYEEVSENDLDSILDDVYELNPETPKIETDRGWVNKQLIFGLDTKLLDNHQDMKLEQVNSNHHELEVEIVEIRTKKIFQTEDFKQIVKKLNPEYFYRVKGLVQCVDGWMVLNYVAGRYSFTPIKYHREQTEIVCMGYKIHGFRDFLAQVFSLSLDSIKLIIPHNHHH
jgi:G3E family GTPase